MASNNQTILVAGLVVGGAYLLSKGGGGKIDSVKGPLTNGQAQGGTFSSKIPAGAPMNYVNVLKAISQGVETSQKLIDGIFKIFGTKPDGMPRIPAGSVAGTQGSSVTMDWKWSDIDFQDPATYSDARIISVDNISTPDGGVIPVETASIDLPDEWADAFAADPTILEDYLYGISELGDIEPDVYSDWAGTIGDPFDFDFGLAGFRGFRGVGLRPYAGYRSYFR